jgi:hypothetical protein
VKGPGFRVCFACSFCKKEIKRFYKKQMKDIILYVVIILMGIMGGGASIYILVSLPAMLIWKIYRKIRYGYSMFD